MCFACCVFTTLFTFFQSLIVAGDEFRPPMILAALQLRDARTRHADNRPNHFQRHLPFLAQSPRSFAGASVVNLLYRLPN